MSDNDTPDSENKAPKFYRVAYETQGKKLPRSAIVFDSKRKGPYYAFSNFSDIKVESWDGNREWPTAEHYFQAGKAVWAGDGETLEKLKKKAKPKGARILGNQISPFDADGWEEASIIIMARVLLDKFGPDSTLRDMLINTGERLLVEAESMDTKWATGYSITETRKLPTKDWLGENLLGELLMVVRENLREHPHFSLETDDDTIAQMRCEYKAQSTIDLNVPEIVTRKPATTNLQSAKTITSECDAGK